MNNEQIICAIDLDQVQRIAQETVGRELSCVELADLQTQLSNDIDWYGAISQAVQEIDGRN